MSAASSETGLFDLDVRVADGVRTVAVAGELDLATAPRFSAAVATAIDAGPEKVVVDLSGARFIDSSGIRALMVANRQALDRGVALAIVPAPARVHDVFVLCRVDTVLPFVANGG